MVPSSTIVVIWILYLLTDHTINIFVCLRNKGEERSQAFRHSSAALSGYLLYRNIKEILLQSDIVPVFKIDMSYPQEEQSTMSMRLVPCTYFYKTKKGVSTINLKSKWNILRSLFNTVSKYIRRSYLWYALLLQNNLPMLKNNLIFFTFMLYALESLFWGSSKTVFAYSISTIQWSTLQLICKFLIDIFHKSIYYFDNS